MKKWTCTWISSLLLTLVVTLPGAHGQDRLRWDLISLQFGTANTPNAISAGGFASAWQLDPVGNGRWKMTMTGTGTFSPWDSSEVTGGGNWTLQRLNAGRLEDVSRGTYTVTALVSWVVDSPQLLGAINRITNTTAEDFRNGLAVFRIAYSDGSKGALIVSCAGPGSGPQVYEGISMIKGHLHFAWPELPVANVDANRTVFVVLR